MTRLTGMETSLPPGKTTDEFEFVALQRSRASHAISETFADLQSAALAGADPALWAQRYPWGTTAAAFAAGLTAACAIVPRRPSPLNPAGSSGPTDPRPMAHSGEAVESGQTAAGLDSTGGIGTAIRSLAWTAAYGLGRMALTQVLNGWLADNRHAGFPHSAEEYHYDDGSWQMESPPPG